MKRSHQESVYSWDSKNAWSCDPKALQTWAKSWDVRNIFTIQKEANPRFYKETEIVDSKKISGILPSSVYCGSRPFILWVQTKVEKWEIYEEIEALFLKYIEDDEGYMRINVQPNFFINSPNFFQTEHTGNGAVYQKTRKLKIVWNL